jgi:hypothetical protein
MIAGSTTSLERSANDNGIPTPQRWVAWGGIIDSIMFHLGLLQPVVPNMHSTDS